MVTLWGTKDDTFATKGVPTQTESVLNLDLQHGVNGELVAIRIARSWGRHRVIRALFELSSGAAAVQNTALIAVQQLTYGCSEFGPASTYEHFTTGCISPCLQEPIPS